MALQWADKYVTGEAEVDAQHRSLFDYLNQLETRFGSMSTEDVQEAINFLGEDAQAHFKYEEERMTQLQCPSAAQNKFQHEEFLQVFTGFCTRAEKEGATEDLLKEIHAAAVEWVDNHICDVDVTLRDYV